MTTAKQSWFKRSLSVLMVIAMAASAFTANAFSVKAKAESYPEGSREVRRLEAPVEDGVYTASIELMNANSTGTASMGNAALRGSSSFLQKNPDDTEYQSLVVVEDGQATALLEFMPMGYIGQYGFMMELESVDAEVLTKYGYPDDDYCTYTPADVIAEHRTQKGEVVYDPYNNPDSASVYDGSNPVTMTRPAGYGHDEDRLIDIAGQPYQHILALDVTPIASADSDGNLTIPEKPENFDVTNAAYVHVFVPVMFSISPTSGDQYARMQVDWTSMEKIENPEENLQYRLWRAKQISSAAYTSDSYANLQAAIDEVTTQLENIWPYQQITMNGTGFSAQPILEQKEFTDEEQAAMVQKLNDAIDGLEEIGDKTNLNALITEAESKVEADYTPNSWAAFQESLKNAKAVQADEDAGTSQVNAAAQALEEAMKTLTPRVDTSKLTALVVQAKEIEQGNYTDESWDALQKAIAVAEEALDNPNLSQDDISGQEGNLQNAINGLVEEGTLDKNSLEDGVYSIYGEMVKTNRQEKSMSNDAINHTIKLTVEDGKYYLTMDFHGLAYLNKFGYLAELSYYDNGYTYGQYGTVEGALIPATVLSTQKNADGSDLYDEFNQAGGSYEGKLYPDQIKFPLVAGALADEDGYVPLHVFVPVMEDISEGAGDQDVLLKLDWSTLKETTEDDPNFEPEKPVEQSPAVDYTDAVTGVKVSTDKGVFDEGVQIVISGITKGADYDVAVASLSDVGKKFKLYEIHFENADGVEVQPNGTVTVYYPIPAGYDEDNVVLYRINEDGTKTLVKGTVENGFYKVITKSFSTYALVEKGSTITDAQNTQNVANGNNGNTNIPQTGDSSNVTVFALLALAAAGMMGVTLVTRKRKSEES